MHGQILSNVRSVNRCLTNIEPLLVGGCNAPCAHQPSMQSPLPLSLQILSKFSPCAYFTHLSSYQ